jgi:hypothetical protein
MKANELENMWNNLRVMDNGFIDYDELGVFINSCNVHCSSIEYPVGIGSCDPSTLFVFDDGSYVYVGNPYQATYPATAHFGGDRDKLLI